MHVGVGNSKHVTYRTRSYNPLISGANPENGDDGSASPKVA